MRISRNVPLRPPVASATPAMTFFSSVPASTGKRGSARVIRTLDPSTVTTPSGRDTPVSRVVIEPGGLASGAREAVKGCRLLPTSNHPAQAPATAEVEFCRAAEGAMFATPSPMTTRRVTTARIDTSAKRIRGATDAPRTPAGDGVRLITGFLKCPLEWRAVARSRCGCVRAGRTGRRPDAGPESTVEALSESPVSFQPPRSQSSNDARVGDTRVPIACASGNDRARHSPRCG